MCVDLDDDFVLRARPQHLFDVDFVARPPLELSPRQVTSIRLADVVGDALGVPRETAQLHLKTIRAAKEITFKGFGRSAAAMTPLDASRLLIAMAGSYFVKDATAVVKRFGRLKPITQRTRVTETLEDCLAKRLAELPMDVRPAEVERHSPEWHQRFGSTRLAETALQLLDPMPRGEESDKLDRYAILRWLNQRGRAEVVVFGPQGAKQLERGTEIADLLDLQEWAGSTIPSISDLRFRKPFSAS
ncbi:MULTISPECIES: hypothetical protein [Bradyrhizobium]|uniref:Uncharacterized protein n=1 Tax=Bradyrhizobium vignae TaxID=1549949 RepID=A0A2U3PVV1_9BRAD|nr:hypothetical protein [Bradyrhizobium vignae]SPP93273.1 protein of unknown function [Bradyrhizobium vignae]